MSQRDIVMQKMQAAGIEVKNVSNYNVKELNKLYRKESKEKKKEFKDEHDADTDARENRFGFKEEPKMKFVRDVEMPSLQAHGGPSSAQDDAPDEETLQKNLEAVMERACVGLQEAIEAMEKSSMNPRKAVQLLESQKAALVAAQKKEIEEIEKSRCDKQNKALAEEQEALENATRVRIKAKATAVAAQKALQAEADAKVAKLKQVEREAVLAAEREVVLAEARRQVELAHQQQLELDNFNRKVAELMDMGFAVSRNVIEGVLRSSDNNAATAAMTLIDGPPASGWPYESRVPLNVDYPGEWGGGGEGESDEICTVCFASMADSFLLPCCHTFCGECVQKLRKCAVLLPQQGVLCPHCRQVVKEVLPKHLAHQELQKRERERVALGGIDHHEVEDGRARADGGGSLRTNSADHAPFGAAGVDGAGGGTRNSRYKDWTCSTCEVMCFGSKSMCFQCGTSRPELGDAAEPPEHCELKHRIVLFGKGRDDWLDGKVLKNAFGKFGVVLNVSVLKLKNVAYVTFEDEDVMDRVLSMHHTDIEGCRVNLVRADKFNDRTHGVSLDATTTRVAQAVINIVRRHGGRISNAGPLCKELYLNQALNAKKFIGEKYGSLRSFVESPALDHALEWTEDVPGSQGIMLKETHTSPVLKNTRSNGASPTKGAVMVPRSAAALPPPQRAAGGGVGGGGGDGGGNVVANHSNNSEKAEEPSDIARRAAEAERLFMAKFLGM